VLSGVQGCFFLRKKQLCILLSLYTNWKNALALALGAIFCCGERRMRVPLVAILVLSGAMAFEQKRTCARARLWQRS
jgi:hypothetical protein